MVETVADSSPGISSTRIVVRDVAGSVRVCVTEVPSARRNAISIGAGAVFGFASRISRSKNSPVAPSAR